MSFDFSSDHEECKDDQQTELAAEALMAATMASARASGETIVAEWGAMAESVHASQLIAEHQRLLAFLCQIKQERLALPLHSSGIESLSDLRKCNGNFLRVALGMKESSVRKLSAALDENQFGMKESSDDAAIIYKGSDNFRGSYDEVLLHEARQTMPKGTLIKFAKDPITSAKDFLLAARVWPDELVEIVDFDAGEKKLRSSNLIGNANEQMKRLGKFSPHNLPNGGRIKEFGQGMGQGLANSAGGFISGTGGMITELGGRLGGQTSRIANLESGMTVLHLFLSHCPDLNGAAIVELHTLKESCLTQTSSLWRTPIHHFFGFNKFGNKSISPGLLWALFDSNPNCLIKLDVNGETPLDLYFKYNNGQLDPTVDAVVFALCVHCESWGLDVLAKSSEGHRSKSRISGGPACHDDLPERFRVLLNGDRFEVEDALRKMMGGEFDSDEGGSAVISADEALANLKFLFVVLPLRSPCKYGLDSTHGLQLMARVFTTTADIFTAYSGPEAKKWKAVWLQGFVDVIQSLVDDEGMLRGMLSDVPSRSSIEALSSSELMSIILTYKYLGGPVIIYWLEFVAFAILFLFVIFLVGSENRSLSPPLPAVLVAMLFNTYFTLREAHFMYMSRKLEMEQHRQDRRHAAVIKNMQSIGDEQGGQHQSAEKEMEVSIDATIGNHRRYPLGRNKTEIQDDAGSPNDDEDVAGSPNDDEEDKGRTDDQKNETLFHSKRFSRESTGRFLNEWLCLSLSWRSNVFNWISVLCHSCCWLVLVGLLRRSVAKIAYPDYSNPDYSNSAVSLHVAATCFLCLRFLGFVKGISIKTATFILMVSEVFLDIDIFLVVLLLFLCMFAILYHILLVDSDDEALDVHNKFGSSLWKVWGYSLGELDDTAAPSMDSYFLFSAFSLVVIIIMMNILIAIVSDSYSSAISRSTPLFWRARVELMSEYEPLIPKLKVNDLTTEKGHHPPKHYPTWQSKCLQLQEGIYVTTVMFVLVLLEVLYIRSLESDGIINEQFFGSLGISLIFFFELMLRVYVWRHTYGSLFFHKPKEGNFFTNPFRAIDIALVTFDIVFLIITFVVLSAQDDEDSVEKEGGVGFARMARLAKYAKSLRWIRIVKMTRSCRVVANWANRWRIYARPTFKAVAASIEDVFESLEEESSWAGRTIDPTRQTKQDIQRSSSEVLHQVQAAQKAFEQSEQRVLAQLARSEASTAARIAASEKAMASLVSQVTAQLETLDQKLENQRRGRSSNSTLLGLLEETAAERENPQPEPTNGGILSSPMASQRSTNPHVTPKVRSHSDTAPALPTSIIGSAGRLGGRIDTLSASGHSFHAPRPAHSPVRKD